MAKVRAAGAESVIGVSLSVTVMMGMEMMVMVDDVVLVVERPLLLLLLLIKTEKSKKKQLSKNVSKNVVKVREKSVTDIFTVNAKRSVDLPARTQPPKGRERDCVNQQLQQWPRPD